MKTNLVVRCVVAGVILLAQVVLCPAAQVWVDLSANYDDPSAVTQATGPLSSSHSHYTASYVGSFAAGSGSASASGLQITSIEVSDPLKATISSPGISSASGIVYGVPEPSRTPLLLIL